MKTPIDPQKITPSSFSKNLQWFDAAARERRNDPTPGSPPRLAWNRGLWLGFCFCTGKTNVFLAGKKHCRLCPKKVQPVKTCWSSGTQSIPSVTFSSNKYFQAGRIPTMFFKRSQNLQVKRTESKRFGC